jgi:hypothetical protein
MLNQGGGAGSCRERETSEGGEWLAETVRAGDPYALGPSAVIFLGESGQAELRSSIQASQLGMAEGLFLYEVGSAQLTRADLTNNQRWDEVGVSQSTRPTKHTLNLEAPRKLKDIRKRSTV